MANSKRHLALLNLQTALETISTLNGYANDVASVVLHALDFATARSETALPAIGIVPGQFTYEQRSAGVLYVVQSVTVEFIYAASSDSLVWSTGDALVDDIVAASQVDESRGGYALGTFIRSAETDAGCADTMDSSGGTAAGLLRLDILLHRTKAVS